MYFTDQNLIQRWMVMELNVEPMDVAQRIDDKNGLICVVMFTCGFMVIKMSKLAHSFVFSADNSKKSVTVWAKICKCILKILFTTFRKCYGLLGSELPLA